MARKASNRPEFPLLTHLDDLVAKLHEHVPAALDSFDAGAVHAARVATRRLSAALDLMEPVISKRHRKPLAAGLKRLRRRLGPLRDADVMIEHLADLAKDRKLKSAVAWLAGRLERDRAALHETTTDEVSVKRELQRIESWPLVRQEIAEAREAVDTLLAESLHLQADAFAEQADRLVAAVGRPGGGGAGGSRAEGDEDEAAPAPLPAAERQNPHDLRIAGKALRYTLEMADAEGRSPGAGVNKAFKKMQELLGDWHDFVVLVDRTLQEVVAAELAHHDAAAADRMLELARVANRLSARELSAFAKLWVGQGEKVAAKIRDGFPLTKPLDRDGPPAEPGQAPVAATEGGADRPPAGQQAGAAAAVAADGSAKGAGAKGSGTGPGRPGSGAPADGAAARPTATPAA